MRSFILIFLFSLLPQASAAAMFRASNDAPYFLVSPGETIAWTFDTPARMGGFHFDAGYHLEYYGGKPELTGDSLSLVGSFTAAFYSGDTLLFQNRKDSYRYFWTWGACAWCMSTGRQLADVTRVEFTLHYTWDDYFGTPGPYDEIAITDVRFDTNLVPLPPALPLMAGALGAIACVRKKGRWRSLKRHTRFQGHPNKSGWHMFTMNFVRRLFR